MNPRIPQRDIGDALLTLENAFLDRAPLTHGILGQRWNPTRQNGGAVILTPAGTIATPDNITPKFEQTLIDLSSEGEPDPQVITVGFFRTVQDNEDGLPGETSRDNVPAGSDDRCVADLTWGSGKGKNRATIDFTHGQRISITASALTVRARYIGDVGPPVLVSAEATYDSLGGNIAQFTDYLGIIPASSPSGWRAVPDFARELILMDNGSPATSYSVQFSSEPAVNLFQTVNYLRVTTGPGTTGQITALPIPNGMDFYRVTNIDTSPHPVFALFKLFL